MKTKEVEQITGLSKQTLIWYEKEGLICPKRNENQYREYSHQDIKVLQLIKMLRNMDISIDDIRQILEKHLPMEEVLKRQKAYLRQEGKRIEETEKNVHFYEDTKAPMVEGLYEMYKPRKDWMGREKSLEPFHIGTPPDRKQLKKLLLWNVMWLCIVIFLSILFICRFENVWEMSLPVWVFAQVIAAIIIFSIFGFGIPQLGLVSSICYYSHYAELSREGVFYIKTTSLADKARFLWKSFRNQADMVFVPYEGIEKVTILHGVKYMKFFTPIANELFVTSVIFHFKDKTSYSIFDRLLYGNEEDIILRILKEYVGQIEIKESR